MFWCSWVAKTLTNLSGGSKNNHFATPNKASLSALSLSISCYLSFLLPTKHMNAHGPKHRGLLIDCCVSVRAVISCVCVFSLSVNCVIALFNWNKKTKQPLFSPPPSTFSFSSRPSLSWSTAVIAHQVFSPPCPSPHLGACCVVWFWSLFTFIHLVTSSPTNHWMWNSHVEWSAGLLDRPSAKDYYSTVWLPPFCQRVHLIGGSTPWPNLLLVNVKLSDLWLYFHGKELTFIHWCQHHFRQRHDIVFLKPCYRNAAASFVWESQKPVINLF